MILSPGSLVAHGKYQIIDLLGVGGFGEVYKAHGVLLDRFVAIKVIQHNTVGSTADEFREYKERFSQEAKVGAAIHDDAVIAVYDLEQEGELVMLVTEYAEEGNLGKRIAKKCLTPDETIDLGTQVCKGLTAIHSHNYVHRDIKPSNILFDERDHAKIADLGLVQIGGMSARSMGTSSKHPGTPAYMSPEQETITDYLTPASDLYSLGCVLFEAITGKVYKQMTAGTRLATVMPDLSFKLTMVIEKSLAVNPADRYQTAEEMSKALEQARPKAALPGLDKQTADSVPIAPGVFVFRNGMQSHTPEEWAKNAEQSWADGAFHLGQGTVEPWLAMIGRNELATKVMEIRNGIHDPDLALDAVVNLFISGLAAPQVALNTTTLDYNAVSRGERKKVRLTLWNDTRGVLAGEIGSNVPWLKPSIATFKIVGRKSLIIEVELASMALPEGETSHEEALIIKTNGGQKSVSAHVTVKTFFIFSSKLRVETPVDWAKAAEQNWPVASSRLIRGELEVWLQTIGQNELAANVTAARQKAGDPDVALDAVINLIIPDLPAPHLTVNQENLEYGVVNKGDRKLITLNVANSTRGFLYGQITSNVPWLKVTRSQVRIQGFQALPVEVWLEPEALAEGENLKDAALQIKTNGGELDFKAHVNMIWKPVLIVDQDNADYGEHLADDKERAPEIRIKLINDGGGLLTGEVHHSSDWLEVTPDKFELSNRQEITLVFKVKLGAIPDLGIYKTEVEITSNGGKKMIKTSIKQIIHQFKVKNRWGKWIGYSLVSLLTLAGAAIPIGYCLSNALGVDYNTANPSNGLLAALGVFFFVSILLSLTASYSLSKTINPIENFYHRGDLAPEIPDRTGSFLRRMIFGLLVAGCASGINYLVSPGDVYLTGLDFTFSSILLAGVAGFLFGFLVVNPVNSEHGMRAADLWSGGIRSLFLAVVTPLLIYSTAEQNLTTVQLVLFALLGLLLGAEHLPSVPLRIQWYLVRLFSFLPSVILMIFFFNWFRMRMINYSTLDSSYLYNMFYLMDGYWLKNLLAIVAYPFMAVLGLWFNTTHGLNLGEKMKGYAAAVALSTPLVLLAELPITYLGSGSGGSTFWGIAAMTFVILVAGACLWALVYRRMWWKNAIEWLYLKPSALTKKVSNTQTTITDVVTLKQNGKKRLVDYFSGIEGISEPSALAALATFVFGLPSLYYCLASIFGMRQGTGNVIGLGIILVFLEAGMIILIIWRQKKMAR